MKKLQWATPSGIDHDYNYLRTVERSIEGAGQDAQARGIGAVEHASKGAARAWLPDSTLQRYLARHRIIVKHAPTGMSRQKSNQTRVTKRGNVVWTVEWVGEDGQPCLNHECNADVALDEVRRTLQAEIHKTKRKPGTDVDCSDSRLERKRKREGDTDLSGEEVPDHDQSTTQSSEEHGEKPPSDAAHMSDDSTSHQGPTESGSQSTDVHFYLRKPATASPNIVLIPLEPTATLTESLQDRTVQEYPTIYTLQTSPSALPAGFILEADYLKCSTRKRDQLPDSGMKPEPFGHDGQSSTTARKDIEMDAKAILDMLKRDVTV